MKLRLLLAALCLAAAGAVAQPSCPASGRELPLAALYGQWEARFDGLPGIARLQLSRHPDYAGVRGTVTREDDAAGLSVAQLAGDVDDEGLLSLDESMDGRAISGVWIGELQAASCGREFKGTWRNAADDSTRSFVMTKRNREQP